METNREKFVRLAENRVNNAIKTLRLIGNLSNQSNYSYKQEDVDLIFKALEAELKNAKSRFTSGKTKENDLFSLD